MMLMPILSVTWFATWSQCMFMLCYMCSSI